MRRILKTTLVYIKSFLDFSFFMFCRFVPFHSNTTNSILFINTGQIGDLVISSIIFENDVLLNKYSKSFFLMRKEYISLFDKYKGKIKILELDEMAYKYNLFYRIKFLLNLRKLNIKIVYNLSSARPTWNDTLALCINSKEKYCFKNHWNSVKKVCQNYTDNLYTKKIALNYLNEYERINSVVGIFIKQFNEENYFLTEIFSITNISIEYEIIIAPFSSDFNRDLNSNFIKEIANKFFMKKILVLCSSNQRTKLDNLKINSNIIIASGDFKLNELFSVINNCKIFIGVDSGLTHIALKTKAFVIALIGGGNYGRYLPKPNDNKTIYLAEECEYWGCEWNCKREKVFCIENISIVTVINKINSYFNNENT